MSSDTVISVENVSKSYRLGEVGTGTLAHDLNQWWHRIRGKPDPYAIIGKINGQKMPNDAEEMWALKDLTFDISQGEVLGILGPNGAGKSTLLKILSRITRPTSGRLFIKGCLASLLEVGTGFHQELTGRENIYLNGAILGMTRADVNTKFQEIAEFSGVGQFLDTPVKRYSSGMYVRLAFSVAAHLEPDVLIVDEVLAVGDADFQKRCIDRMDGVAKSGRTVLFVSHNLSAVKALCNSIIRLDRGKLIAHSRDVSGEIESYLSASESALCCDLPMQISQDLTIQQFNLSSPQVFEGTSLSVIITIEVSQSTRIRDFALILFDQKGSRVSVADGRASGLFPLQSRMGTVNIAFNFASLPLVPGVYKFGLYIISDLTSRTTPSLGQFTVIHQPTEAIAPYPDEHRGLISLNFSVTTSNSQY